MSSIHAGVFGKPRLCAWPHATAAMLQKRRRAPVSFLSDPAAFDRNGYRIQLRSVWFWFKFFAIFVVLYLHRKKTQNSISIFLLQSCVGINVKANINKKKKRQTVVAQLISKKDRTRAHESFCRKVWKPCTWFCCLAAREVGFRWHFVPCFGVPGC